MLRVKADVNHALAGLQENTILPTTVEDEDIRSVVEGLEVLERAGNARAGHQEKPLPVFRKSGFVCLGWPDRPISKVLQTSS